MASRFTSNSIRATHRRRRSLSVVAPSSSPRTSRVLIASNTSTVFDVYVMFFNMARITHIVSRAIRGWFAIS